MSTTTSRARSSSDSGVLPPPGDGYRVHAKQRSAIEAEARYKVLKWGRRAGKNVVSVIELIEFLRDPSSKPWGRDDPDAAPDDQPITVWWVGPSYDQAEKYGFEKLKAAIPGSWIEDQDRTEPYRVELVNGTVAEFRTFAHPDTLQGAGVDGMIIDERDYMPDSLWYDDLEPMLMDFEGWALWISKPVRPRSLFNRWFELGQSNEHAEIYSSHATSADNPFIAEDPEDKRDTVPEHVFMQQYLAKLPDDGGAVFKHLDDRLFTADYDLEGQVYEGVGEVYRAPETCTPPFAIGVDLARHQDWRVTTALDASGELAYWSRDQNESWDGIESDLLELSDRYPGVVIPDASRDNKLISDLIDAGLQVVPMQFTPKAKRQLIEDLITMIESGELSFPDDTRLDRIALELRLFERDVTAAGNTRYHAPDGEHDDCVDSLALAGSMLDRLEQIGRQMADRDGEGNSGVDII